MCKCHWSQLSESLEEQKRDMLNHTELLLPFSCQICHSAQHVFSYHYHYDDDYDINDECWFECTNCYSYIIANSNLYNKNYKEIYHFDDLDLVVVKDNRLNFIYYETSKFKIEETPCVELPEFEFTKENIIQKMKTYSIFL